MGAFEVQEYRKPEFEVILTPESRFVVQGQEAVVTVQARYYFGQPVANAQLRYVVNRKHFADMENTAQVKERWVFENGAWHRWPPDMG